MKKFLVFAMVCSFLLASTVIGLASDCWKGKMEPERKGYMKDFLGVFSHPLFLSEKKCEPALCVSYEICRSKISAYYKLSCSAYQKVEVEEEGFDPFECRNNPLKVILKNTKSECQWCFLDKNFDGIPDEVNGYRLDRLPKKVRKELTKKFEHALKELTEEMVERVRKHFCL